MISWICGIPPAILKQRTNYYEPIKILCHEKINSFYRSN